MTLIVLGRTCQIRGSQAEVSSMQLKGKFKSILFARNKFQTLHTWSGCQPESLSNLTKIEYQSIQTNYKILTTV